MNDNPLDMIQSHYSELTNTDKEIAIYILNNPRDAARAAISQLASRIGVSKSALVRFANRVGYNGFAEFKFDLSRFLVSRNALQESISENDPVVSIVSAYSKYILSIREYISAESVQKIAERILQAKRVKLYGYDRTFNSAMQMKQRLLKIGLDAEAVSLPSTMYDYSSVLKKDDLVIVFTVADNSSMYKDIVKDTSEECPVICFTMTDSLPFRKWCEEYVVLPKISRDSSMTFLDDQAIFFVFIEILLDAIALKTR